MRHTTVQSPLAAILLLSLAVDCATAREPLVEGDPKASDLQSNHPTAAVGLPRPDVLPEGRDCSGVVVRVLPSPQSEREPYWGCFEAGQIDRAFSPGQVNLSPLFIPGPTSVIEFEVKELDGLGAEGDDASEEYVPNLEIEDP